MLHKRGGSNGGGRPKTGRDARLSVCINAAIHKTIKANAAIHKISLAEYVERILLSYLSEDPDVAPPKTEE